MGLPVGKFAYRLATRDSFTVAMWARPASVMARKRVRPSDSPAARVAYPRDSSASTAWVTTLGFMPKSRPSSPWLMAPLACKSFVSTRYWVMFNSLAAASPWRSVSWAISKATKYVESRLNLSLAGVGRVSVMEILTCRGRRVGER